MLCNARLRKHLCRDPAGVDGLFCTRHTSNYRAYGPLRFESCCSHLSSKSSHFVDVTRNVHYTVDHGEEDRVYRLQARGRRLTKVGDGMQVHQSGAPWYIRAVVASQDNELFVSCVETYALALLVDMFLYMDHLGMESDIDRLVQVVDEHVPDSLEALTRLTQLVVHSTRFTRVLYTAAQRELPTLLLHHTDPPSLPPFRDLLRITTRCGLSDHSLVTDALALCTRGSTTWNGKVIAHLFQTLLSLRADEPVMTVILHCPTLAAYETQVLIAHLLRHIPLIVSAHDEGLVASYDWIRLQIRRLVSNDSLLTWWVVRHIIHGTEPRTVQFCLRQGKLTSLCDILEHNIVLKTGKKHLPRLVAAGLPVTVMDHQNVLAVDSLIHRLAQKADESDTCLEALEWLLAADRKHATLQLHAHRQRPRSALETPLHTAIWFRQWRTVEMLLSYGASPHARVNPPISYALYRGHTPTLQKLLDHSSETIRGNNTQLKGRAGFDTFCTRVLQYAISDHTASDTTLEWLVHYITTHVNGHQKSRGLVEYAMQQSHPFAIKVLLRAGWEEPTSDDLLHTPLQNVVDRVRSDMIQSTLRQHVRAADTIIRDYLEA